MLVIWKMRELHTPSFALLFCLAVSDFLVGLVGQPSFVAYKVAELLEDFNGYCKVQMIQFFTGWITSGVSFFFLCRPTSRFSACPHMMFTCVVSFSFSAMYS